MDPELSELLTQGVTISTGNPTRDINGVETWSGSGSTYPARYVTERETRRGSQGHTFEQSGIIWVDSTTAFTTQARVTTSTGEAPPVFAVESIPDENGLHHQKLRLGWRSG